MTQSYKVEIVWRNVAAFLVLHMGAFYGLYLVVTGQFKFPTLLLAILVCLAGGQGITAGAHRLWAHRSYKARWPLRLLLAIFQAAAFQNDILEWARDHRGHHKWTDTNADPHSAARGFFFSHMGWLLVRKHPEVMEKGKTLDLSDLTNDWVVAWQHRNYWWLMPLCCFIAPVAIPYYCWNEDYVTSLTIAGLLRYTWLLHVTWLVNSAAHIWGMRPYDKTIYPAENLSVAILAYGEGWHNYHHTFPWDYKTAELGNYRFNITTATIDFMAWLGLAYDLKSAPLSLIKKVASNKGDKSRYGHSHHHHKEVPPPQ